MPEKNGQVNMDIMLQAELVLTAPDGEVIGNKIILQSSSPHFMRIYVGSKFIYCLPGFRNREMTVGEYTIKIRVA